jgi:hypothetical protein
MRDWDMLPDRAHIDLWKNYARDVDPDELRRWRSRIEQSKNLDAKDPKTPRDSFVIYHAILIAIREELQVRRRGNE